MGCGGSKASGGGDASNHGEATLFLAANSPDPKARAEALAAIRATLGWQIRDAAQPASLHLKDDGACANTPIRLKNEYT